jgi:hypothetical protein
MAKSFTELPLGCQLHQEVMRNRHSRDLPCPHCQGQSNWMEVEKDQTATGRRFPMDKGAFTRSQEIMHNRGWRCPVWQPCWFTSKAVENDDFCWWSDTHQWVAASNCIKSDNRLERVSKIWVFSLSLTLLTACEHFLEFVFVIKVQIMGVQEYVLCYYTLWCQTLEYIWCTYVWFFLILLFICVCWTLGW